jgi:phosphatidylglycerophosphatase A
MATGLGVGYSPWFPGTLGSLWGIPLFYAMRNQSYVLWLALSVVLVLVSIGVADRAEKALRSHDSSKIVIDEIVGYFIAVFALPFSFKNLALAFFLFRLFDILKPYPIRVIDQKWKGGFGVVMDDVASGVAARLVMHLILIFWS